MNNKSKLMKKVAKKQNIPLLELDMVHGYSSKKPSFFEQAYEFIKELVCFVIAMLMPIGVIALAIMMVGCSTTEVIITEKEYETYEISIDGYKYSCTDLSHAEWLEGMEQTH